MTDPETLEQIAEENAQLRDWMRAANQFAWAHERGCPRKDGDAPCNCGLDAFLSRPRLVVETVAQAIAAAEAQGEAKGRSAGLRDAAELVEDVYGTSPVADILRRRADEVGK